MIYKKSTMTGTVEILAADEFVAIPVTIDETAAVKAGTPISAAGKKLTAATDAAGILLYDVDPTKNPVGAILVQGVLNLTKANASSGLSLTASAVQTALPGIVCRTNIGVNA